MPNQQKSEGTKKMKKLIYSILITAFSILPITASATYISTEYMDVDASGLTWNNYYADYDAKVNPFGGSTEVFCVENANMDGTNVQYDFYTIGDDLADFGVNDSWLAALTQATWYANWFLNSDQTEQNKKDAQVAAWYAIGFNSTANYLVDRFNEATDQAAYASNWLLAVNPALGQAGTIQMGQIGQNYLVNAPAPVPEPSTMLLLGSGLLGLAYYRRRKSS